MAGNLLAGSNADDVYVNARAINSHARYVASIRPTRDRTALLFAWAGQAQLHLDDRVWIILSAAHTSPAACLFSKGSGSVLVAST